MRVLRKLVRFVKIPLRIKLLLPEALWLYAGYHREVLRKTASEWGRRTGVRNAETPNVPCDKPQTVAAVRAAVRYASLNLRWKDFPCLNRALTAKRMLNRRGLPCTLYMGVRPSPQKPSGMEAHAWLRCGDIAVTGGDGSGYVRTASYADVE